MKTLQTGILISFIIILFMIVTLLNRPAFAGTRLNEFKKLIYMVFPPKDLYNYLVKEKLDITNEGLVKKFEFKNKYVGNHECGIVLDNFSYDSYSNLGKYKLQLKIEVNFYIQDVLIKSCIGESNYGPFLGAKETGFLLIMYKCPEDLPINKLITCKVKIIEPDKYLFDTYGPVKFYIQKMSDK